MEAPNLYTGGGGDLMVRDVISDLRKRKRLLLKIQKLCQTPSSDSDKDTQAYVTKKKYIRQYHFKKLSYKALYEWKCLGDAFFEQE